MKKLAVLVFLLTASITQLTAEEYTVQSPDKNLVIQIQKSEYWNLTVLLEEVTIIDLAEIGMQMQPSRNSENSKILNINSGTIIDTIYPEIPYKRSQIIDHYDFLQLRTDDGFELEVRVFNDGFAYRFKDFRKNNEAVVSEKLNIQFPQNSRSLFPEEESTYSHNERLYLNVDIDSLDNGRFCSLPVLFESSKGGKIVLTESSLHDYPNMFIEKNEIGLSAMFPPYVIKTELKGGRDELIHETAGFIAKISKDRTYPWRIFIIGKEDKTMVESTLAYQLAEPCAISETNWIKPGKVAWDWYNDNNLFGVDFRSGLNTDTYKYYIDFAADNGIEYVILDEGWTKSTNEILDFNPDMDIPHLIEYAKTKNIGIILWVLWRPLNSNTEHILSTYKSWGAKGVKVDFMQRSDQTMVSSYEKIAAIAARYELLVNFHGAFKPAGLQRKYPNVLNFEGVKGGENNKWSKQITPTHNLTIPFIRMVAGPMDYTPGSMINYGREDYPVSWSRPASQGTRCHQLAMYIIYEAPLQMLCESPSIYIKEQESVDFITEIPTTWDETKVLQASIGKYLVLARRKGDNWYIGAMNDWEARSFEISTDFLSGTYEASIMQDGVNSDRYAQDYKHLTKIIARRETIYINMKSGGGFAAHLKLIEK